MFPGFFSSFVYYCEMYNHGYFLMHYFFVFLLGHLIIRAMHLSKKEKEKKRAKSNKKKRRRRTICTVCFSHRWETAKKSLSCEIFIFQKLLASWYSSLCSGSERMPRFSVFRRRYFIHLLILDVDPRLCVFFSYIFFD